MMLLPALLVHTVVLFAAPTASTPAEPGPWPVMEDTGYRGIWYANQGTDDRYVYKYSGGLGTYCAKHIPHAIHAPAVNKTFFVYGGSQPTKRQLLETISYYDHETGQVPRPVVLLNKETDDAHDNPVLAMDDEGRLWVFASSHGTGRPSYIFRSTRPHDIGEWELVLETNFSYPQPWHVEDKGFLFLHTYYKNGRGLNWWTSASGEEWHERQLLAHIEHGHYQVSWPGPGKVGTAFNYHPLAFQGNEERAGLNWRTNLYYLETANMGASWQTAAGHPVEVPLREAQNAALVRDYEAEGRLVYMKGLQFDAEGNPAILYITSNSWRPGPEYGPREWTVAYWREDQWHYSVITHSNNNYDTGSLLLGGDGVWRVLGPTGDGPQMYNPGGEMVLWESRDQGATWTMARQLTRKSVFNHTYARAPLHAAPGFMALWADGHGRRPSESRLYIYNHEQGQVLRLPYTMDREMEKPAPVYHEGEME